MQFSVKITDHQKNTMLNICDVELLGKNIVQDEMNINISKSYYGEKLIEKEEAKMLMEKSSIINMVGKETTSLSIDLGIGSENGIKLIDNIPFLIVLKCNMLLHFNSYIIFNFKKNLFYLIGEKFFNV